MSLTRNDGCKGTLFQFYTYTVHALKALYLLFFNKRKTCLHAVYAFHQRCYHLYIGIA